MKNANNVYKYLAKIIIIFYFLFFYNIVFSAEKNGQKIKVTVEGVKGSISENVLLNLSIERYKEEADLTSFMIRRYHEKALEEIKKALQPFGYYSPKIEMKLTENESGWYGYYKIDPGRPVIIREVELYIEGEGADNKVFRKFKTEFPLNKGEVLNHKKYEEVKRNILDTALEAGFISAVITEAKVEVYPEKESAKINLHINTGRQYYFGEIRFIQDTFNEKFITGFIPFKKGDPYSSFELLKLQNSLNNSDYFKTVNVTPLIDEKEEDRIPVKVQLTPRAPNKYTFGFGYGTDTGLRGSAGWERRILNDDGHRFKITLRLSEIKTGITAEYLIPLENPRTDNLIFTSGWQKENIEAIKSDKKTGGIRYNHLRRIWNESIYLNYELEKYKIAEDSGTSKLLIPGISWTYTRVDNPMMVRKGRRFYFDIKGAYKELLSTASFIQIRSGLKYVQGLTSKSRIIMRTEGGTNFIKSFSDLPASVRFFAGGDNSVRGYGYNTIGPRDKNGNVTGGRYLLTGSIEFDHIIKGKWSSLIFYDIGNAVDSISDPLKKSVGTGVQWRSPVGPVRLNIAFPLNDREVSWRIHFIIGPDI